MGVDGREPSEETSVEGELERRASSCGVERVELGSKRVYQCLYTSNIIMIDVLPRRVLVLEGIRVRRDRTGFRHGCTRRDSGRWRLVVGLGKSWYK